MFYQSKESSSFILAQKLLFFQHLLLARWKMNFVFHHSDRTVAKSTPLLVKMYNCNLTSNKTKSEFQCWPRVSEAFAVRGLFCAQWINILSFFSYRPRLMIEGCVNHATLFRLHSRLYQRNGISLAMKVKQHNQL